MKRLTHIPAICARVSTPVAFRAVLAVLAAALGTLAIAVTVPVAHASSAGLAGAGPAGEDAAPFTSTAASVALRNSLGVVSQTATAPGAPENLSAAWRSGEVSLYWDVPASDGGSAITGYEYRYRAGGSVWPDAWSSAGPDLVATVNGLSNAVAHTFEVRAVNTVGRGSGSSVKVMPLAPREGDMRIRIGKDNEGPIEVLINDTWGKVCDDEYQDARPKIACRQLGFSGGIETYGDYDLPEADLFLRGVPFVMDNVVCTGRERRLIECRHVGTHNCYESELIHLFCDTTGLGPPRNVTFIPNSGGGTLVWNAPARNGGAPNIRYDYRSRRAGGNFTDWTDAGRNLMAPIAGLSEGGAHIFEVRAVNSAGTEAASVVNGVITDFTLVAWDGTGSQALHDGTTVMLGDYRADTFTIRADTIPYPNVGSMQMTLTGSLSHNVTKNAPPWRLFDSGRILPLGDYQLNATAYAEDGRGGAQLDTLTIAFTVAATAPEAPENLSAHWANDQLALSWQAPASDGGPDIIGYQHRNQAGSGTFTAWSEASLDLTTTIPSVADGAAYTFEVRAVNPIGTGDAARLTTPAGPGKPQDLAVVLGSEQATLSWAAPAHNGGATITGYQYRHRAWNEEFGSWADAAASLTATVPNLNDAVYYVFEVRGMNAGGNGLAAAASTASIVGFTLVSDDDNGDLLALDDGVAVVLAEHDTYGTGRFGIRAEIFDTADIGSMKLELTGPRSHIQTENGAPWSLFGDRGVGNLFGERLPVGMYRLSATAYPEPDLAGDPLDTRLIDFAVVDDLPQMPQRLSAHWANNQVTLSWQDPANGDLALIAGFQHRHQAGNGDFTAWSDPSGDLAAIIPNVADNAAKTYQVRAVNAAGFGTEASLTTPAEPSIPRDLTASSNNGTATLSWAAPARNGGATSTSYWYRHRELDGDFGDWTDAGSNLTATVTGLAAAAGYVFEVRAVNVGGAGPPASASPATITGFTLSADDDDAEPLNLKNGAIVMLDNYETDRFGIRVDASDEYAVGSMALTLTGRLSHFQQENATPWSLFGDQQGDLNTRVLNVGTYRLRATAYSEDDLAGDELGMHMVDFTVVEDMAEIPEAPQNLLAHFADGNLTFSWDAPADNGGSIITGYEYQYKAGDAEFTEWSAAPTDGSQAIANVTSGAAHTFAVWAVNANGSGYAASLTTPVAPGEPRELSVEASSGQATLTWTPPAHNGGGTVTGYQHRHRVVGGEFNGWTNAGANLNATASGLTNGTTYEFQVRAANSVGEGATVSASALVSMTSVVTGFTLVDGDDNADLLALTDGGMVLLADHATNSFAIRVEVSDDDAVGWMELTLHGPGPTHNQTEGTAPWSLYGDQGVGTLKGRSLTPGSYRLSAAVFGPSDQGGAELGTWEIAFKVVADMPDAPQNLAVHWADGGLTLSWQAPANSAIAAVTGYQQRHKAGDRDFTDWSADSTNRTATIPNVASAAAYTVEARAVNADGPGDAADLTTPVVPSRLRNLSATPGSGQATLSWTAPAHNGGASIAGYEHRYRASDGGFSAWTGVGAHLTATVSGLTNGTEYLFEVRAVNDAGNGPAASASAQVSMARIITGFTLVDDDNNANLLTLADSATVALANYATDSFAIRVEVSDNGAVGRMELELTGPQTHSQTEYLVPWSLYGDEGVGNLTGRSLTVGTYGLSATVYTGSGEDSAVLDKQSITFTVVVEE